MLGYVFGGESLYVTDRLFARPVLKGDVVLMANILNQLDMSIDTNGKFYEDGKHKNEAWIENKKKIFCDDQKSISHAFSLKKTLKKLYVLLAVSME